jgi:hypothetical protein
VSFKDVLVDENPKESARKPSDEELKTGLNKISETIVIDDSEENVASRDQF